jgi:hypothetical protein
LTEREAIDALLAFWRGVDGDLDLDALDARMHALDGAQRSETASLKCDSCDVPELGPRSVDEMAHCRGCYAVLEGQFDALVDAVGAVLRFELGDPASGSGHLPEWPPAAKVWTELARRVGWPSATPTGSNES